MRKYSLLGILRMIIFAIRTKFVFKDARLIRFPFDIRGRRFVSVSKGFTTGFGCRIEAVPLNNKKTLLIGENFQMNDYVHITAMESVIIGNNVLIASKVYISDCSHGSYAGDKFDSHPDSIPKDREMVSKPIKIEDNVWLGEFVSVLPGVTIGKGTIVGANSVVSKSLPPYVIAVGAPAKAIKKFNVENNHWERIKQ